MPVAKERSSGRVIAMATAVAFGVSSAFPAVAGLAKGAAELPRWWGVLDVLLAFVLMFLAIRVATLGQRKVSADIEGTTYRAYRALTHGILVLLVVFFLIGERINWTVWLTGFAWRAWLLLYTLPPWLALVSTEPART